MTSLLVVAIVVAVVAYFAAAGFHQQLANLRSSIDEIQRELEKHRRALDTQYDVLLTIRSQTESQYDRDRREWDGLVDVTIEEVRKWKPGDTINLVSRSYMYPSEKAATDRFEFKFEAVEESPDPNRKFVVTGSERDDGASSWFETRFYVNEEQATTSTFEGTIRRRKKPEDFAPAVRANST